MVLDRHPAVRIALVLTTVLVLCFPISTTAKLRGMTFNNQSIRNATYLWLNNHTAALELYGHISTWDVSRVTDFSRLFLDATDFNEDLSVWDIHNAKDTSHMFQGASSFTSDLSGWDTANVRDTSHMLYSATLFTSNLSTWNVENVFDFSYMFAGASMFDGDVSTWDITNSHSLKCMFWNATSFRGDVSRWTIPKPVNTAVPVHGFQYKWAQTMQSMFEGAVSFDGDLSQWDTWGVYDMNSMFKGASNFSGRLDGALDSWDVRNVNDFRGMFVGSSFDQDLCWSVKSDANISRMFDPAGGRLRSDCSGDTDGAEQPTVESSGTGRAPVTGISVILAVASGLIVTITKIF